MTKLLSTLILLLFSAGYVKAQTATLNGTLVDGTQYQPVSSATVQLMLQNDSTQKRLVVTDSNGYFEMRNLLSGSYSLTISSVGFKKIKQTVELDTANKKLGTLVFTQSNGKELEDVVVVGKTPPVQQKGDTVQYNASQYKTNPDATSEDLIAKMPGITVATDGTVTAHGDQVKSVTVDGKKFFGDDATAALRNLPAEVVDKIQVFDKLSDQAAFTGFDDGNSVRAINIVTKPNMRNGSFGRMFAGYGSDNRYNVGGNVNFFHGDRRLSFVGLFNNINQQNFSSQDLLGFSNNSGRGGRGGGAPNIGAQSGITKTNAIGINYTDMWGKKLEVQASYFFNNGSVDNNGVSNIQTLLSKDSTLNEYQTSNSNSTNYNHRVNLRFDYKIDSANLLTITPTLGFQKNNSFSNIDGTYYFSSIDTPSNTISNRSTANANGYNLSNNILYRHAFAKKGRTVSVNLGTSVSKNDGNVYLNSLTQTFPGSGIPIDDSVDRYTSNNTNGYQLSANVAYTEPIGKKGQLQLNYSAWIIGKASSQKTKN